MGSMELLHLQMKDELVWEEIKYFPYSSIRLKLQFERYPTTKETWLAKREFFELVDGDKHIALVIGDQCLDKNGVYGFYINKLEVNKPYRKNGYGSLIIKKIVELYKPNFISLCARSYRLMHRYYLKIGFYRIGWRRVRKDYK